MLIIKNQKLKKIDYITKEYKLFNNLIYKKR